MNFNGFRNLSLLLISGCHGFSKKSSTHYGGREIPWLVKRSWSNTEPITGAEALRNLTSTIGKSTFIERLKTIQNSEKCFKNLRKSKRILKDGTICYLVEMTKIFFMVFTSKYGLKLKSPWKISKERSSGSISLTMVICWVVFWEKWTTVKFQTFLHSLRSAVPSLF